jgi:hypothetical protein
MTQDPLTFKGLWLKTEEPITLNLRDLVRRPRKDKKPSGKPIKLAQD